ncbi:MAG: hypothetical protein QM726_10370 [Chitinophagaceae bacterium]
MKNFLPFLLLAMLFLHACKNKTDRNININASLNEPGELVENPLLENVITTSINPKDSTMQTLYGNKIAWDYADTHSDLQYPEGSKLYSVTWKQKPDSLWFGANTPKEVLFVEEVAFIKNSQPAYIFYQGNPLRKAANDNSANRLSFILSQKMAVSP